jgi:hypothetical protein
MHEEIRQHIAALNAVWQLYARAIEQQLDTIPIEALNRDFVAAREGLAGCGIVESMLVYDSVTMTFSLPITQEPVASNSTRTGDQNNGPCSREAI